VDADTSSNGTEMREKQLPNILYILVDDDVLNNGTEIRD